MSWHTALGRLLLLCCFISAVPGILGCSEDAPDDCSFQYWDRGFFYHTLCNWTSVNFALYSTPLNMYDLVLGLDNGTVEGELTSRTACSTRGSTFCLSFKYYFEVDNAVDLIVSVKYERSDQPELLVWTLSSDPPVYYYYSSAQVPITTDGDFQIVFKIRRRPDVSNESPSVFIDTIRFVKMSCLLLPRKAKPPSSLPTTSSTVSPTLTPITTAAPSSATPAAPITKPVELPDNSTLIYPTSQAVDTSKSANTEGEPAQETSNVIIGVVVAVIIAIIIVIIIVVVLVLYRRKRQAKEGPPTNACDNVAYSLDADDVRFAHVTPAANHRAEAGASDYYNITMTSLDSEPHGFQSTPRHEYVNFSPHRRGCRPDDYSLAAAVPPAPDDTVGTYSILEESGNYEVPQGLASNDSNQKARDGYEEVRGGAAYETSDKTEEIEDYNRLDFAGKSLADMSNEGEADSNTYNHLDNEQEDAYRQMNRSTRTEVIDNEYSHLDDQQGKTHDQMDTDTQVIDNESSHV